MGENGAVALPFGAQVGLHALAVPGRGLSGATVDHEGLAFGVLHEQALLRPLGGVHQQGCVGPAGQVVKVHLARLQQAVDQRQDQQAVGAGRDAVPVIGHGGISGADGVDADHPRAARLQLADADLDGVAVVILGHAEHHEHLGARPVGLPEFPERAADGVDAARRHVHAAKATVGGIVRRAELLRPPAGQRLALVAPGEESQLLRRGFPQGPHPFHSRFKGFVPGDFLVRPRSARPDPPQRRPQARRRGDLHDPAGPLAQRTPLLIGWSRLPSI